MEVKSETEDDMLPNIKAVSEELKKLNLVERIKEGRAELPKCQL